MTKLGILKFKKYKEARKGRPTTGKYYAKAVQDRTVDFEDFVTHMSEHNSPYSRGVIHGVLIDMLSCLQELVLDGKSVRLGELGLFSIGMTTRPADTAELFTVQNITGVHLNVRNTKAWSNAELRKKCRLQELSEYTVTESTVEGDDDSPGHSGGDSSGKEPGKEPGKEETPDPIV